MQQRRPWRRRLATSIRIGQKCDAKSVSLLFVFVSLLLVYVFVSVITFIRSTAEQRAPDGLQIQLKRSLIALSKKKSVKTAHNRVPADANNESPPRPIASRNVNITHNTTSDTLSQLPPWLRDYMAWHTETRINLEKAVNELHPDDTEARVNLYMQHKYLVLRCLHSDHNCAGLADRIQSVPQALTFAYESKRLFFIYWQHPAPLQHFLMPNNGFDWRMSDEEAKLLNVSTTTKYTVLNSEPTSKHYYQPNQTVVCVKKVLYNYFEEKILSELSDEQNSGNHSTNNSTLAEAAAVIRANYIRVRNQLFKKLWNALFVPVPSIRAIVDKEMHDLGLTRGDYVSLHIRSLYTSDNRNERFTANAVNCAKFTIYNASKTRVFVASDSGHAVTSAKSYADSQGIDLVHRSSAIDSTSSLHFDRGLAYLTPHQAGDETKKNTTDIHLGASPLQTFDVSAYYNIFVDLLILSRGQCVVYGSGGFGRLSSYLAEDPDCSFSYRNKKC